MKLIYSDDKKEREDSHEISISCSCDLATSWCGYSNFDMTVWDKDRESVIERLKTEFGRRISALQEEFYSQINNL